MMGKLHRLIEKDCEDTRVINTKLVNRMKTLEKISINLNTVIDKRIDSNAFRIFCLLESESLRVKLDIESICTHVKKTLGISKQVTRLAIQELVLRGYIIFE